MKKILLLILAVFTQGAYAQTTVNYAHRFEYYPNGYGNGGGLYNVASEEVGLWANQNNTAKQSVAWRPLKTAGDGSGQNRTMAVGDEFSITIAATRAYGQLGVALLANPSTNGWDDRLSNYVAQVNLDGQGYNLNVWGQWYVRYTNGETQSFGIAGSTNYTDYVITFKLQSANRMTVSVNGTYIRDFEINGTALPTHYSVYLADDWNGEDHKDVYVKPGYLKSTGVLELGYFNNFSSLTFSGVNNGVKANSVSEAEVNTVYAGGNGPVSFDTANTFTGSLTVNPFASLTLGHSQAIAQAGNLTVNGYLDVAADDVTVAPGKTLTLSADGYVKTGSNNFIGDYNTHSIAATSTVEFNGENQEVAMLSGGQPYGNIVISGTGDKVLAGSTTTTNNFTKEGGSTFTVAEGQTLTVGNELANNGSPQSFIISNNAALLQQNTTGMAQATVKRNSNLLYRLDYTLWGAPVSGQGLLEFSPATSAANPSRFYSYAYAEDDGLELYRTVTDPANTLFEPGKGYLIRMPNTDATTGYNAGNTPIIHNGTFTGTLHNGDTGVSVMIGEDNQGGHYAAVSNPYPSPINIAGFFTQNAGVLQAGNGIYFWRKRNNAASNSYGHLTMTGFTANTAPGGSVGNGGDYYTSGSSGAFNEDWIISPGQGFFVKLKDNLSDDAHIIFTNSMRRAAPASGGQPFFKTQDTNEGPAASRWWLNLTGANAFAQTLTGYLPEGTEGLDYGYDARILTDGTTKLYSKAAESDLAIQARPVFTNVDVVPLGFSVPAAGQYTLGLDHVDGVFAEGQEVYLKDNLLGTVTSLNQGGYLFTSDAGTFDSRFEVVYQVQGALGANQPGIDSRVVVYQNSGALHISAQADEIKAVTLYDVQGRTVYAQSGINATEAIIERPGMAKQVLVVEIDTVNGKAVKKIVY